MLEQVERYEVVDKIGEGGFAIVYRAHDTRLDRLVALKALRPVLLADESWVRRFLREARAIAQMDHPHIIAIHDVLETDGGLFIVMRLVDGPSLEGLINSRGRLEWAEALRIMTEVAAGLDYAHQQGILHRDLKPANILVDPSRGAMLSDFGFAKLAGEHSMSMTADGGVVGTPHYIAPEVWDGKKATAQADIYALGCILFEMLTGDKVFKGETPPAVMLAHFKPLVLPESWPGDVPPGVTAVLNKALADKPRARYATAGQMAHDLAQLRVVEEPEPSAVEPEPVAVLEEPEPEPVAVVEEPEPVAVVEEPEPVEVEKKGGRRRLRVGLGIGLGLLAMVVFGVGMFCCGNLSKEPPEPPPPTVGPPVSEELRIPVPEGEDPPVLSINFSVGELRVNPGAEQGLVEGNATYNRKPLQPQVVTQGSNIRLEQPRGLDLATFRGEMVENRWELRLGQVPMHLNMSLRAAHVGLNLGGLSLLGLTIDQGATEFNLNFSEPNRVPMERLDFKGGASAAMLRGLANSRAEQITFHGGAGEYTLDFNGILEQDMMVEVEVGLSSTRIVVPPRMAAEVSVEEGLAAEVEARGPWQELEEGERYVLPGEGPTLYIEVEVGAGELELVAGR